MVKHLFANFLQDEQVYALAEGHWIQLWGRIDSEIRDEYGWQQPWFEPLPPALGEGNPIFTAVSPSLRRGIRILQSEPTEKGLEFVAYLDTFGGTVFDPYAINELVISCALSDAASRVALSLMLPWVEGKAISLGIYEGGLVTSDGHTTESIEADLLLPNAA